MCQDRRIDSVNDSVPPTFWFPVHKRTADLKGMLNNSNRYIFNLSFIRVKLRKMLLFVEFTVSSDENSCHDGNHGVMYGLVQGMCTVWCKNVKRMCLFF